MHAPARVRVIGGGAQDKLGQREGGGRGREKDGKEQGLYILSSAAVRGVFFCDNVHRTQPEEGSQRRRRSLP